MSGAWARLLSPRQLYLLCVQTHDAMDPSASMTQLLLTSKDEVDDGPPMHLWLGFRLYTLSENCLSICMCICRQNKRWKRSIDSMLSSITGPPIVSLLSLFFCVSQRSLLPLFLDKESSGFRYMLLLLNDCLLNPVGMQRSDVLQWYYSPFWDLMVEYLTYLGFWSRAVF